MIDQSAKKCLKVSKNTPVDGGKQGVKEKEEK